MLNFKFIYSDLEAIKAILWSKLNKGDDGKGDGRGDLHKLSDGYLEMRIASNIRYIAGHVVDVKHNAAVRQAGAVILKSSFELTSKSYDEGDPICPEPLTFIEWLIANGFPKPKGPEPEPDPKPWQNMANRLFDKYGHNSQVLVADLLRQTAALTINAEGSKFLLESARNIMAANASPAAYKLFDEYCGNTIHRIPTPRGLKADLVNN